MNETTSSDHPRRFLKWIQDLARREAVRQALTGAFVVVGGVLQYLYVEAKHPSTLLEVWAWIFRFFLLCALITIAVYGYLQVRGRHKR